MKNKFGSPARTRLIWHLTFVITLLLVLASGVFLPKGRNTASADGPVVIRRLPATVSRGQTFDVTITFTAPENNFKLVGLTDHAPESWPAQVDQSWCTPEANAVNAVGNIAEVNWRGNPSFDAGVSFTAVYKVTVPQDATDGFYSFDDGHDASLLFFIGNTGPFSANLTGDSQIKVIAGSHISGEIYAVNGTPLPDDMTGATITLSNDGGKIDNTVSAIQSHYRIPVTQTGVYLVTVSQTGFKNETQSINITTLEQDYTLNFKGNLGLIPNAPDIWYVLDCAAVWKYPPADPELGLDIWRVLDVAAAWKYPVY